MVFRDERSAKAYETRLAQLIAWAKVPTSKDSTGAASASDARPIWRR